MREELQNIVREIEKAKLNAIWKLLQAECRKVDEEMYIVEAIQNKETKIYDEENNCFILKLMPESSLSTCETQKQAFKKMALYEKLKYDTKLYHTSIEEIEDLLRKIDRQERGII